MKEIMKNIEYHAENGDAEAQELLVNIKRFEEKMEQKKTNKVRSIFDDITHEMAKVEAISTKDPKIALTVFKQSMEWCETIEPGCFKDAIVDFIGENREPINDDKSPLLADTFAQ